MDDLLYLSTLENHKPEGSQFLPKLPSIKIRRCIIAPVHCPERFSSYQI